MSLFDDINGDYAIATGAGGQKSIQVIGKLEDCPGRGVSNGNEIFDDALTGSRRKEPLSNVSVSDVSDGKTTLGFSFVFLFVLTVKKLLQTNAIPF